jgi:uncharacterized protein YmfQ (DUF2313 family)
MSIFSKIIDLTRKLYPTGRAWKLMPDSVFLKFHQGLAYSEERVHNELIDLLDSVLPDNDNFDLTDAYNWEKALGLITNTSLTLAERKSLIERKINHPGNILARQNYRYLEGQLQAAGFDVYVHENRFPSGGSYVTQNPTASIYGTFNYGGNVYGSTGSNEEIIANHIESSKDAGFATGGGDKLRFTFFIGGQTYPARANVVDTRKKEFRDLILKIKPAQTVGFLLIDYV